jgi:glutamate-1-semialdehyde 2,1-aminomutase
MGRRLWDGLAGIARDAGLPLDLRGAPAVFSTSFVPPDARPVTDFRSAARADAARLDRFWRAMHHRGVQFTAFGIWFLSTAHTESDIGRTLDAAEACLREDGARGGEAPA